jgi:hypothetical protein
MANMLRAEMENACVAAVDALTLGYTEEVTWREKSGRKTVERTGSRRFGPLLDQLRLQAADPYASKQGGPTNNPNKSVSRPPVNQAMLDLVDSVDEQADRMLMWLRSRVTVVEQPTRASFRSPESKLREIQVMCGSSVLKDAECAQVLQSLSAMVSRCREMLGHDSRRIMLADKVCHVCGGALSVAQDASTDVECVGYPNVSPEDSQGPCGVTYARLDWLGIMAAEGEQE